MRNGTLSHHDTTLGVWEEHVDQDNLCQEVYGPLVRYFRDRGFLIHRDPDTKRNYPSISRYYHRGRKGDLEIKTQISGRHIELKFFQNVNHENPCGGEYDFDQYQKMPYLIKKQWIKEATAVLAWLETTYGYQGLPQSLMEELRGIHVSREPLRAFNKGWTPTRFKRGEDGWPVSSEYDHGGNVDREGVHLRNGMWRWYRDRYTGYLRSGTIYTNMNTMWLLIYGPGREDHTYVPSWELFTLQPTDKRRRCIPASVREARLTRLLKKAVDEMHYERAAILRDVLYGNRETALLKKAEEGRGA